MSAPDSTFDGFPFHAVFGHDDLKLALILCGVDPSIGGVLLRGEKGSAKTTLARSFAPLLPGTGRFVDLPVGASEDRVVGSIDLAALLNGGSNEAGNAFRPGLLHAADGGVLYIDEVNLLPDHIVDVLLDVAATGVNRVERDGVSHDHRARFVLIGSMNPEEGELRPQFLDRFGLVVDVHSSTVPSERAEAVRRRLAFESDAESMASFRAEDMAAAARLRECVPAEIPTELVELASAVAVEVGAEGLRADITLCRAAAALAGWEGRSSADESDLRRVSHLVLAHRRRRNPLDPPTMDRNDTEDAFDRASDRARTETDQASTDQASTDQASTDQASTHQASTHQALSDGSAGSGRSGGNPDQTGDAERTRFEPSAPVDSKVLTPPRIPDHSLRASGFVGRSSSTGPATRGRAIGDAPIGHGSNALAVVPTLRRVGERRVTGPSDLRTVVQSSDLREAVRESAVARLVVFVVDASASMAAHRRIDAATGAVLGLLADSYRKRDRVALVSFAGNEARVVLRPTGSIELAKARLVGIPVGGKTPLAAGILAAHEVIRTATAGGLRPFAVLLTDGRATEADSLDPIQAALEAGSRFRRDAIETLVVDVEDSGIRLHLAQRLADAMGATCIRLDELVPEAIEAAVRKQLGALPTLSDYS